MTINDIPIRVGDTVQYVLPDNRIRAAIIIGLNGLTGQASLIVFILEGDPEMDARRVGMLRLDSCYYTPDEQVCHWHEKRSY